MSKHCPSSPAGDAGRATTRGGAGCPAAWLRRVFRNSFTRLGRARKVKRWSFKIQFHGRRRTFSLAGRTRAAAAREAQQLYAAIVHQGWETAMAINCAQRRPDAGDPARSHTDRSREENLAYWEQRLIQRRYREARLREGPEYSVRIERNGAYAFFPLGSNDPRLAAAAAREIDQVILTAGWPAALARYEREITVAIFWSANPAAATYSTLFTLLRPPAAAGQHSPAETYRKPLIVLEPAAGTHLSLRYWLDRQPGFCCPAIYRSARGVLAALAKESNAVVLVNGSAPDMARLTKRLQSQWPGLPVLPYHIYEDSDQIWLSVSGVDGGYIYRRRPPAALLDPLMPAAQARTLSAAEAAHHVRNYFESFFSSSGAERQPLRPALLTTREQEILRHLSSGYLDKEIAQLLSISIWTVHNHMKSIYDKLGVHNRTEAALKYLQR